MICQAPSKETGWADAAGMAARERERMAAARDAGGGFGIKDFTGHAGKRKAGRAVTGKDPDRGNTTAG